MSDTIQYLFFRDEFQFWFYKWEEGEHFISGERTDRSKAEGGNRKAWCEVSHHWWKWLLSCRTPWHLPHRGESGLGLRSAHRTSVLWPQDSWNELLIGDVELKRVMACSRWDARAAAWEREEKGTVCFVQCMMPVCVSRCILTTVDPDTGVMSRKEPLETLKR